MFHPHRTTLKNGQVALIRQAELADAEALIAHVNEIGAEGIYIMTGTLRKTVEEERRFIGTFDGHSALFIVAILGAKLVGSADFSRGRQSKNAHTASLGIAIRREARGQGLGRAMLEAGIQWARSGGIRKLTLGVFQTNEPAIALYRRLGFAEEGRLRGQVILRERPVDEILMALRL